MNDKKCILILPYFGKFNNYFSLFLKSCEYNPTYNWLILTDDNMYYNYPQNVKVIKTTLSAIKELAIKKLGFSVSLDSAYKLCDFKPTYGLLFEEYIKDYVYWGHCDCDLIFGNLEKLLTPLLDDGIYDKLFAAGHLTLYRNTYDNNRRFMKKYRGELIYKIALSQEEIYIFDEDMRENNIHRLFLEDGAKVYQNDLSMNPTSRFARFRRSYYNPEAHYFYWEDFKKGRYYWNNGNIVCAEITKDKNSLNYAEYIYMHFQARKMRMKEQVVAETCIQILPDRFVKEKKIPTKKKDLKCWSINWPYLYWIDRNIARVKRKFEKIKSSMYLNLSGRKFDE